MQTQIKLCRGIFFLKINKPAEQIPKHMQVGINVQGEISQKKINVQTKIRLCRGKSFLKINKPACTSILHTRVDPKLPSILSRDS